MQGKHLKGDIKNRYRTFWLWNLLHFTFKSLLRYLYICKYVDVFDFNVTFGRSELNTLDGGRTDLHWQDMDKIWDSKQSPQKDSSIHLYLRFRFINFSYKLNWQKRGICYMFNGCALCCLTFFCGCAGVLQLFNELWKKKQFSCSLNVIAL